MRGNNMETKDLIGLTVKSALINGSKDVVVLETDKGKITLAWEGDCCASCYLANFNGIDALIGAIITEVEHSQWEIINDLDYNVLESMGTKIKTNKGYVDFETRVEHNGYYGGYLNVYKQPEHDLDLSEFKPLDDF